MVSKSHDVKKEKKKNISEFVSFILEFGVHFNFKINKFCYNE